MPNPIKANSRTMVSSDGHEINYSFCVSDSGKVQFNATMWFDNGNIIAVKQDCNPVDGVNHEGLIDKFCDALTIDQIDKMARGLIERAEHQDNIEVALKQVSERYELQIRNSGSGVRPEETL